MRRVITCFKGDSGGASALEFAILLPVFLTMLFGTIQIGLLFFQAGTVQYALEETARDVMVRQDMTPAQIEGAIRNRLQNLTLVDVQVTYAVETIGDASVARVNASFTQQVIIPLVPTFEVPLTAQASVPLVP